jgi:hypothetical protein
MMCCVHEKEREGMFCGVGEARDGVKSGGRIILIPM